MRYAAIVLLTAFSLIAKSQAVRLGYTKEQLWKEFNTNLTIQHIDTMVVNGKYMPYISFNSDDGLNIYWIDNASVCYQYDFKPLKNTYLNELIRLYNKTYVPVSDTYWKWYTKDGSITYIELINNSKGAYFTFGRIPK